MVGGTIAVAWKDQLASVNYCSAACPLVLASRVGLHVPTRHGGAAILHVIQVSHVIAPLFNTASGRATLLATFFWDSILLGRQRWKA